MFTTRHKTPWSRCVDSGLQALHVWQLWAIPPVEDGLYNIPSDDGRYGQLNILNNDTNDCMGSYDVRSLMDVYWRYALQAGNDSFAEQVANAGRELERMKRAAMGDPWSNATLQLLQAWVDQHRAFLPAFNPVAFPSGTWFGISHSDHQGRQLPPVEFQITLVTAREVPDAGAE